MKLDGPADWTPERHQRVRMRIAVRLEQQRRRRQKMNVVAATLAVVVAGAYTGLSLRRPASSRPIIAQHAPAAVAPRTADAVVASPGVDVQRTHEPAALEVDALASDTVLEELPQRGLRQIRLSRGGLHVRVHGRPQMPLQILAAGYVIEHVGTTFSVVFESHDLVRIAVEEGKVHVTGQHLDEIVEAGSSLALDTHVKAAVRARPLIRPRSPSAAAVATSRPFGSPADASNAKASRDEMRSLLRFVDDARASGRMDEAIVYLDWLLAKQGADDRTAIMHFVRGKLLLQVGRCADAAADFAAIQAGPLLPDAQQKAVQARSRCKEARQKEGDDATPP